MPRPIDEPQLSPVQPGGPSRIPAAALVVVALVVLAILKPWGGSAVGGPAPGSSPIPGGEAGPSGGSGPAGASPTIPAASPDPNAITCTQPDGWRLVTLQQAKGLLTRTWLVVTAVAATSPAELRGPVGRLAETDVVGLGFCAEGSSGPSANAPADAIGGPSVAPEVAGQASIAGAWRLEDRGHWVAIAVALAATGNDNPASDEYALLYAPAPLASPTAVPTATAASTQATWAPGSYAFRVTVTTGSRTLERWFRLDLVWPPVPETPSPSPSALRLP